MIRLSDYIFGYLASMGIRHVFMLAGGGSMYLVDSLGRNPNITYICNLHEQCAAIAAEAYSQYTGNLGVALVTSGPGGTNSITGVAAAWIDSTPMMVISGQVKRADLMTGKGIRQFGFQEINIVDIVKPITKYAVTVMDPDSIRYHLEKAIHLAKSGRPGPVWLDIPLDVQSSMIDETHLKGFCDLIAPPDGKISRPVDEVCRLISSSKRPIFLIGNGVRLSGARDYCIRVLEDLGIPVLLTWRSIDFLPDNHGLFVGRPGLTSTTGANANQNESDLIIVIGSRLDMGQTAYDHDSFAPNARKVMVDIDPNEIRKMRIHIDVPIVCDAGDFLYHLHRSAPRSDHSEWLGKCKSRYNDTRVRYDSVGHVLDTLTGTDVLVLGSAGAASERCLQSIRVPDGLRIINSPGLGSMGFAIPAAIGVALASNKHVVCIDGDGSFVMNSQELSVIDGLKLPIDFHIMVNDGYGSIRSTQDRYFESHYVGSSHSSGLHLPPLTTRHNLIYLDPKEVTIRC